MSHTPIAYVPTIATVATGDTAPAEVEHPAIAQLRALELKVMTSYTLADAMREGSQVIDKREGGWIARDAACALGAAYLAARAREWV